MSSEITRLHAAADSLLAIEQALRRAGLWHAQIPEAAALTSRVPFCADTLAFSEWLQFVFLARMRYLIEAGGPLPEASAIAPFAEEALSAGPDTSRLVRRLRQFDRLITVDSGRGARGP